jgi:dTDP-4-dehydrorhamnose 3,5-epimerase
MPEALLGSERVVLRPTAIPGVMEVDLRPMDDSRGSFVRLFEPAGFIATGLFPSGPVQVNIARTDEAGTVRGLHWQDAEEGAVGEAKLVTCVAGRVFDVAVDVRKDSPTRFAHHSVELVAGQGRALLIPPGVAHGMQALENASILLYLHSTDYRPDLERGARPDDPAVNIRWPLPMRNLSARDLSHPSLDGPER